MAERRFARVFGWSFEQLTGIASSFETQKSPSS
jgi:hypothetical protein